MYSYRAYGLSLRSDLRLPELGAGDDCVPDAVVCCEHVSDQPVELERADHHAWAVSDGLCMFWKGVGVIAVLGGEKIVIDPAPEAEESRLRLFILGAAMAVLLHQRGLLVLHASAVAISGKAALFLGDKGWGKSTLAAALALRGHAVISDDVVALDRDGQGRPLLLPAFPQIKLWPNSVEALGGRPEDLPRLSTLFDKRHYDVSAQFVSAPMPLARIFLLGVGGTVRLEAVRAQDAVLELVRHSYSARFGAHLLSGGEGARHLLQCSALTRRVPISRLDRPVGLSLLPEVSRAVEEGMAVEEDVLQ